MKANSVVSMTARINDFSPSYFFPVISGRTDKFQLQDTIWPTQVVAMASAERMEPRRFSFRSATKAMPTPSTYCHPKKKRGLSGYSPYQPWPILKCKSRDN